MIRDLTVGNPEKVLLKFSIPLLGSIIFQQLYNIADSFVAGKFIGGNALAAVGNAYEVTLIYLAFAFGCNIGTSVVLALFFGAKRYKDLKTAVNTSFIASGVLCGILMILGFLFIPTLLNFIHTPKEIFSDTVLYLNIYTLGLVFLFFYNISNGIFASLGDSKTPFWFLAISSVSNIFMDILFVKTFKMGVAGVAWATFICQGASCVAAFSTILYRINKIPCAEKPQIFSLEIFKKISGIALPSILQQSFVSVGNIFIQSFVNGFGTEVIAGYSAAIKINNFAVTSLSTLGNGISNFTAQNIGANKIERVSNGYKSGVKMILCVSVVFTGAYLIFRKYLIGLFMNSSSGEALEIGMKFLIIVSPFFFVVGLKFISDGVLRGSGAMAYFMIATFADLLLRVVLAYFLSKTFKSVGIWLSWPIGWIISASLSLIFYHTGVWKKAVL